MLGANDCDGVCKRILLASSGEMGAENVIETGETGVHGIRAFSRWQVKLALNAGRTVYLKISDLMLATAGRLTVAGVATPGPTLSCTLASAGKRRLHCKSCVSALSCFERPT